MGWLVHTYGWQSVFYVMGLLGIAMAFIWRKTIYSPKDHPRINAAELAYIEAGGGLVDLDSGVKSTAPKINTLACIKELLSSRMWRSVTR